MTTQTPTKHRLKFFALPVAGVRELTAESVEITFTVPLELAEEFSYVPGQHIALKATIDGNDIRRSYSLCAPPNGRELKIAVKEIAGGLFSHYARTVLQPGDTLEVMNPQGNFTSHLETPGRITAIVAGSGITPVLALAKDALERRNDVSFTLIYANRSGADIMFFDDIMNLKDAHPTRFDVHHILTREDREAPIYTGRIDDERLAKLLEVVARPDQVNEWFLCGPLELVELCRQQLDAAGVERAAVHFELFAAGEGGGRAAAPIVVDTKGPQRTITFRLDGRGASVETPVAGTETLLAAALRKRSDVPFACAGGVCGTCKAVLVKGKVNMAANFALEPDELERGYILTCQSTPVTDDVEIDFDR